MIGTLGKDAILSGAALSLAVAAPIGPVSLLCIQRTLAGGVRQGWATGGGIAAAHAFYAAVAAAGLAVVADLIADWTALMQVCGALFLLRVAVLTVRRPPVLLGAPARPMPLRRAFATGLAWTLGNPTTLLGFMTLTPGFVEPGAADTWHGLLAVAGGAALGSTAWWMLLATAAACARSRLNARRLRHVNLVAGAALAAFAAVILADAAGWRPGMGHAGNLVAQADADDIGIDDAF